MTSSRNLDIGDSVIEYTLRRSRRRKKTIEISVSAGRVLVSAPMRTPNSEIQAIVRKRASWIIAKLESAAHNPAPLSLVSGETLPYLGDYVGLTVEEADVRKPAAELEGQHLECLIPRGLAEQDRFDAAKSALVAWYRKQATTLLTGSVAKWLPAMGRSEMPRVLVREQRTRWGSCSADGTLRFSWRLAMVQQELIESVAVHELAHLDVMNHSQAFWDVVLRVMPDAKERRKRLAQAGRHLPL